jgi:hypothetical protein
LVRVHKAANDRWYWDCTRCLDAESRTDHAETFRLGWLHLRLHTDVGFTVPPRDTAS